MDKEAMIISESFVSRNESELRENIQKALEEYMKLACESEEAPKWRSQSE